MTTSLTDIRFTMERYVQDTLDSESVIHWMNDAQSDFSVNVDLPATAAIPVTTTDLQYNLPADMKSIVRLWMQSDFDLGNDSEFHGPYRIYNGKIIFPSYFRQSDTLNVDYYKQFKYFTALSDMIDVEDRYQPLYVAYGLAQYYLQPSVKQTIGEGAAQKNYDAQMGRYMGLKHQIIQAHSLQNPDYVIKERW